MSERKRQDWTITGTLILALIVLAGCTMTISTSPRSAEPAAPAVAVAATATTALNETLPPTDRPTALPTDTPSPTDTLTPTPEPPTATLAPVDTPPPADTPTPVETATPEPPPATSTPAAPYLTVSTDVNLRAGPDAGYAWVGLLTNGSTLEIVGRNADSSWWQVAYPDGPEGKAWITAAYSTAFNTDGIPVAVAAAPPATSTPAPPPPTATPAQPTIDFKIAGIRLWTNEENGGYSPNGSVNNCGYGHEIHVQVVDAAGNPLDGVVIADTYNNPKQITGSHGPGRTQYLLYFNGYNLLVEQDPGAGRPVTSEVSQVLSAKDSEIPIPWLIGAHYCANEAECVERISKNSLCQGHYSWDIVFQRAW